MQLTITLVIIIVTVLVSIGAFNNQKIMDDLIFYPPAVSRRNQWYRFFSCGLLHADWGHLFFNMFALYLFGQRVEAYFTLLFGGAGKVLYILMYVTALAVCLLPTYFKNKDNYHYRSLGASGAVSAVVFAGILFDPISGIGFFFIPIYISGFIFGALYLVVSHYLDKQGGGNINHSAHIYGALYGIAFVIVMAKLLSNYPVAGMFIDQIQNTNPKDFIQFGR